MGYSLETTSADCYRGTTCLINKFNIRDEKKLSVLESDITLAKSALLENMPVWLPMDFEYYKSIHKFLFEDIYSWAGELRTVDISKKGTSFCAVNQLEELCENCFTRLVAENYFKGLSKQEFVNEIVDFYNTLNILHPFREGNGRTQRIFISKLIALNGYEFDFANIDKDELMTATIKSANGVNDFLIEIFIKEIK